RNRRPCCCSQCSASSISWPASRRAWRSRRWSINARRRYSRCNRRNKQAIVRKPPARTGRAAAIASMSRDFQLPGRSAVIACEGMAASSHPLASLAAVETLRAGGNAADAAATAVAVLCVVEPHMTGIGGDCFAMIHAPGRPVWGYNGSGRARARASLGALLAQGRRMIAPDSIHAVTVPGAIDAWAAVLAAHGRFSLDRVLAPAIHYGENGFPVAARIAWDWAQAVGKLRGDAGAARHLLFDGRAPAERDVVRLPALAQSLKTIAAQGPRAFYEGPLAQDMVATVAARGSFLAAEDFARHRGEVVAPIATNYRGLD